jgi:uncharacterized protein (TIGR02680 family)
MESIVERFEPTRAGIVNLWDYRDEEFVFASGWLVLRGPNGSGKTKALELLFPFLLDGRIDPGRLNPFASRDRTMKSNLVYGGKDSGMGYVWMEFRRGEEYTTIGIGLRAHRHSDKVTRWHFCAPGRVGVDFGLLDEADRPLTRKELVHAVGEQHVVDTAADYRERVNAALFGLEPERYEQMLNLILTLRKPQLAKDLDPVALSKTLSDGLRPLDEDLIGEAARSFEDMERVAKHLEGLRVADRAVGEFLGHYTTYLRAHARDAALRLQTRLDDADGAETARAAATTALEESRSAAEASEASMRRATGEPDRLRGELDGLKSSEAYRSITQLDDLRARVKDLAEAAASADRDAASRRAALERAETERATAATDLDDAAAARERRSRNLAAAAEQAGIDWIEPATGLKAAAAAAAEARRADLRHVQNLADALREADAERARRETNAADAAAAAETADAAVTAADAAVDTAREELTAAARAWSAEHRDLFERAGVPGVEAGLASAAETLDAADPAALRSTAEAAIAPVRDRLTRERHTAEHRLQGLRDEAAALETQLAVVEAQHDDAPPAPYTRVADRAARSGAPLWRLVRFADGLDDARCANIEAALEAWGVLDAWVDPDGTVTTENDVWAAPAATVQTGPTLADYLVPEPDAGVDPDRVSALLRSIGFGDDVDHGIGPDGAFRSGVLFGRGTKQHAEYIGATARERRRAARIAELRAAIDALAADIEQAEHDLAATRADLRALTAALDGLPGPAPVLTALERLAAAAALAASERTRAAAAAAAVDHAISARNRAQHALTKAVAERHLPVDMIEAVAAAVDEFHTGAGDLDWEIKHVEQARERLAQAEHRVNDAADDAEEAAERAAAAADLHAAQRARLEAAEASIGAEASRVLARVTELETAVEAAKAAAETAVAAHTSAREALARAEQRLTDAEHTVDTARVESVAAAAGLRPFAHGDLLGLLGCPTDLRWADPAPGEHRLTEAVRSLHEAIMAATAGLAPNESSLKMAATRASKALEALVDRLPAAGLDHRVEWDNAEGIITVGVADEDGIAPVAHFARRIRARREDQELLLTDAEQRVLEDALLGELARQIHERTVDARDLVRAMDTQMRARRMSSGLTVGVSWTKADHLDADQRKVGDWLEASPARLGRHMAELRAHFAARIKQERSARGPGETYRDLLRDVLDYRQWRQFSFSLHRPGQESEPLTRARHSQLSGGEQSVSLHLPLFAAANAVFSSARPEAPRMIGLDEAFAGVDENGRSELMGLAAQFDLQLFMTGYDLWATFRDVEAAAHYDLAHAADGTVSTVLMVWNGADLEYDLDGSLPALLGSPESRRAPEGAAA